VFQQHLEDFMSKRLEGHLRLAVLDEFDAVNEAHPANVANHLVLVRDAAEDVLKVLAHLGGLMRQIVIDQDVEAGDARGAAHRIVTVRMPAYEAAVDNPVFDSLARDRSADADPSAEVLREGQYVRHDAMLLE